MNDFYTYQSDCSIIKNKEQILKKKITESQKYIQNGDSAIYDLYFSYIAGKITADEIMRNNAALDELEKTIEGLRSAGKYDAALAWGEVLYIVKRNHFTGWISLLDIYIDNGIISYSALNEDPEKQVSPTIPKKIIQFWDKSPPEGVLELINIWKKEEDSFDHTLVDESFARDFLTNGFPEEYVKAFNLAPTAAGKSDIFRLAYLYENGGLYIDADERRFGNVASLIPEEAEIVVNVSPGPPPCINNWFIGSSVKCPLIGEMLLRAVQGTIDNDGSNHELSPWILSGPGLFTMTILDILVENGRNDPRLEKLFLHTEADYRRVAVEDLRLEYKKDPNKNWKSRYENHLHEEASD
ncbi:glycosyltransferase [Methylobacterium sp. ap11]|uniref:glycosyltransferase family 32 protein n=1 Tax=Methylobacterium sp. ap11 TaxID=1761799 RepID=UPI0015A66C61|nr:glycosyltransferase [Methylobacterium sp. ap11]